MYRVHFKDILWYIIGAIDSFRCTVYTLIIDLIWQI